MAPQDLQQTFTPLRVITQRLTTISAQRLPYVVPSLATALGESEDCFLTAQSDNETHSISEGPVLVHKLKAQISALLQNRSPEAQYAAVVLIKTTVEVGGWSVLQGVNPWIKGLIGIIGKTNTAVTKKLCVLALTRIFILTQEYPSLVRELITPSLAGFITVSLNLVNDRQKETRDDVLLVVMQAFAELIPYHPASFRPFSAQIRALCLPLVAPTPSDTKLTNETSLPSLLVSESARRLYVLFSISAPKNACSEAWAKCCFEIIECIHRTANSVFRVLIEDNVSSLSNQGLNDVPNFDDVVQDSQIREPGLAPWTGINAGIERLDGLLQTLGAFISTPSSAALVIPVGKLVKAIERILSALPPTKDKPVRTRPEISVEERQSVFIGLPCLHISAIDLCSLLLSRMGRDAAAISISLLEQILWTLDHVASNNGVRGAAYIAISHLLHLFGPSIPRSCAPGLSSCIRLCCEDLLLSDASSYPKPGPSVTKTRKGPKNSTLANTDQYIKAAKSQAGMSRCHHETKNAVISLLSAALTTLPKGFISSSLRQQIDRTAILSNTKDIIFTSAISPPTNPTKASTASSLMPFLARSFHNDLGVEALLRPRMPPLRVQHDDRLDPDSDESIRHEKLKNNSFVTNDPQTSTWHSDHAAVESKRQRQESEDRRTGADEDNFVGDDDITGGWPPTPKRQKAVHEESIQALAGKASNGQSTGPVYEPIGEPPGDDDLAENPSAKAADTEPITESSSSLPAVSAIPSRPETQAPKQEVTTGEDQDDEESDDFEMPVLQMDSDDGEDEEDDENEGDVQDTVSL